MIGIDDARPFLVDRFGAEGVEVLSGGEWSRAFGFRAQGRDLVARFGRWREDYERDRLAMSFAGPDLPVPELLEVGDAFDGAYAISVRHTGTFLDQVDADGFRAVLPAVLRALDTMRSVEVPAGVRPEPWSEWLLELLVDRPGGRVSGWREVLARTPDLAALFEAGREAVVDLLPACPDLRHVLHLDLAYNAFAGHSDANPALASRLRGLLRDVDPPVASLRPSGATHELQGAWLRRSGRRTVELAARCGGGARGRW